MNLVRRLPATWRAAQSLTAGTRGGKLTTLPLTQSEWRERELILAAIPRVQIRFRGLFWTGLPDVERAAAAGNRLAAQLLDAVNKANSPDEIARASTELQNCLMPDLVELCRKALLQGRVHKTWIFQRFQLPNYSGQPEAEWQREKDAKFTKFCDSQLAKLRLSQWFDGDTMVNPVARRGPGGKARNANPDDRYEWAALRWLGFSWKSIAGLYRPCSSGQKLMAAASAIEKAANKILRGARLVALG